MQRICYLCIMKDEHKPTVSFIIPCYNLPAEMIAECLDSILALPLERGEREIILVDDGSDVSPLDALGARKNDMTYIRQDNKGLSEARNTGLRAATGRYIQFVDGDDRLLCRTYTQCLDIAKSAHPDIVMFRMTPKDATEAPTNAATRTVSGAQYMLDYNLRAAACGYLFNAGILGSLRFTPGILHEDEDFTPQLVLRAETVCDTGVTAYYYRTRPRSITNNIDKRNIIRRLNDIERTIIHLDEIANGLEDDKQRALKRRVAQLTMDYIYNMVRLTRSANQVKRRLERLEAAGLYPLPDGRYTRTYSLFRRLTKNKLLINLLYSILK